jgi:formamidopyrimidine-DNA glycosylase
LPQILVGLAVRGVERLGKRIVIEFEASPGHGGEPIFAVLHLMIAGRLHWKKPGSAIPKGAGLAALDFAQGSLIVTEAGTKKRASLHLVAGREALAQFDAGGLEVPTSTVEDFRQVLGRENHTLKRALTDPHLFSGIGNAYSDEILHRAKLSPLKKTRDLTIAEVAALHDASVQVLREWSDRLCASAAEAFPEKVTAFRDGMAAHGRFGEVCPVCGAKIQRIVYAENECNYCPKCQTNGRMLADRALSRLLKKDWPTQG